MGRTLRGESEEVTGSFSSLTCCGVPPRLTLACDASPRPLFFGPPRGARTGLKQRVPRPGHPRAGYVNVLGRDFEVETTRHLPALPRPFARRSTMQLTVAYRGRSGIVSGPGGLAVALA